MLATAVRMLLWGALSKALAKSKDRVKMWGGVGAYIIIILRNCIVISFMYKPSIIAC